MGENSNLEKLWIQDNKITHFDLGTNKSLKQLIIYGNVVETLVADELTVIP